MSTEFEPIKRVSEKKKQHIVPLSQQTPQAEISEGIQTTLTQVKVEKMEPKQLSKPIDTVALHALQHYGEDHKKSRRLYSNSSLPFTAREDFVDHWSSFFASEDFYMRWVKMSAEMVKLEINTERALKGKKRFWASLKERFRAELKALHSRKVA